MAETLIQEFKKQCPKITAGECLSFVEKNWRVYDHRRFGDEISRQLKKDFPEIWLLCFERLINLVNQKTNDGNYSTLVSRDSWDT